MAKNQKVPNKLGGTSSAWGRFQGFGFGPSDFGILLVFVSDFDIRISDFESLMSWRDQWPKSKAQSALRHALSPMRDSCKGTGQQR
jgi:hypothetical protein